MDVVDYSQFYVFGNRGKRFPLHVNIEGEEAEDSVALLRGEIRPTRPLRCTWNSGGMLKDILGSSWAILMLVSDRVVEIATREGFTGWLTYPVEVYDRKERPVPGYHGLSVTGRCGPVDESKAIPAYSQIIQIPKKTPRSRRLEATNPYDTEAIACAECRFEELLVYSTSPDTPGMPVRVGLYFDPDRWDGSDFFVPDRKGMVIVTAHLRSAFAAAKISNTEFIPLTRWVAPIIS